MLVRSAPRAGFGQFEWRSARKRTSEGTSTTVWVLPVWFPCGPKCPIPLYELNRLTSVNYGDTQTQSYVFDPMGNRTQKVDSVSGTENSTYNNANRLLTRGTNNYTNDNDGNTLTGGGRTNVWHSENRLASCVYNGNTSTFGYGADGLRHRETVNGTVTDTVIDGQSAMRS
jgi:hypothetical protein